MTRPAPDPTDDRATEGSPGLPHWVKLLALAGVIVGIVLVVTMLLVGGEHGPGRHGG